MAEIALAFFWHQHQPYYPDDVAGENLMPWVRLHGVKDYYGMALHLMEYPEMQCTINFVPSLLLQLQRYTDGGATDRFLQISRKSAEDLDEGDGLFLLDNFFMANPDHMIRPFPRYAELFHRRALGRNSAKEALRRFHVRDLRDLQVLFNLAWIHPLAFEGDDGLQALRAKARGYSEEEKNWLLDKHLDILRRIIPLHRQLQDSGQVELTTTPYFHPILPLLLDKKLAREAMPDVKLPRYTDGYPEDAYEHVRRAVEQHERVFGRPPRGMWPAEGSVCQSMLPLLVEHGIRWIAADEEVLSASTQGLISRDAKGHVRNPDRMYRPYKVVEAGKELNIVFRDHALSDAIGFHYQRSEADAAVDDFLQNIRGIRDAVANSRPVLISIILDGENCWEHYVGGGAPFLRTLYERCVRASDVRSTTIGDFLERHPPCDTLPRLFAGSWINHNFGIWIGHDEDNAAWDALHRTREYLRRKDREGGLPSEVIQQAWEEIYIAEGSDWCWWYGDDHSSAQDATFDYLYRKHLQNVYLLLGDPPPPELAQPISRRAARAIYTLPRAFLNVKVDGRQTFFEWIGAGRYTCQNERGTMALATQGPIKEILFGFDAHRLYVRVDCNACARVALADYDTLRIGFIEPNGWEVLVHQPGRNEQNAQLLKAAAPMLGAAVEVRVDQIAEVAIPFQNLGVEVDQPIQFYVEVLQSGQSRDRAPRESAIHLLRPSPDFEQMMWDV